MRSARGRAVCLLLCLQLVVNPLHEAVEVAALLVTERQALEEQVHQPRLAPADAAPHVEPALQLVLFAAGEQLAEQSLWLCSDQPVTQVIEQRDDLGLRRIGLVAKACASRW